MSIFPFINGQSGVDAGTINNNQIPLFKEIAWDFQKDKPLFENGDFKILEGNKALEVWIYKALKSDRFELEIYSWNYGSEVNSLISKGYTRGLTESEAKRYIEEALLVNKYIKSIEFKEITFIDDKLSFDIKLQTIYGNLNIKL
ncbi:DUF2634 domain-containing protein [Clostridium sp.]|uniref:DUF2634 domain-containing protein n=1 Tax=Clostridium sp. TaxID=1506 RepID=UPI0039956BC5